jgi:hypothetical protein
MEHGFNVVRIKTGGAFKRGDGAGDIARTFLGNAEEHAWTALRREHSNGFAQGRDGGGGIFFEEQDAEIQRRFRHFGIESHGALIFGASFVGTLERTEGVSELKVGVGDVGLFGKKFLKRGDGRGKIIFVDGGLGLIEEIVEGVFEFLRFGLDGRFSGSLRTSGFLKDNIGRNKLRHYKEERREKQAKNKMGERWAVRWRHGSVEEGLAPLGIVAEGPEILDAPLGWRFACA